MDLSLEVKDPFADCQWISTDIFEGYIKDYLPFKARGHYRYINGDQVYYGEWTNGHIHRGIGIITLDHSIYNDTVFIGGWKNGKMSGFVLMIDCTKDDPDHVESVRFNVIRNEGIIYSHEIEKPQKNDFAYLFHSFVNMVRKDPEYRAF